MANNNTEHLILKESTSITPAENDIIVQRLSGEMTRTLIPVTVYMSLLIILGVVGNSFVCYFYIFKSKRSTNSMFIVALAVYDLLVCLFTMPSEILDIELYYTNTYNIVCKVFKAISHFVVLASILTLVAIATDRFKRICRQRGTQMSMDKAKGISVIIGYISLMYSVPSLFMYGVFKVPIETDRYTELYGHSCTWNKDTEFRPLIWAYVGSQLVIFIVMSMVLIILYCLIGQRIYRHKTRLSDYKQKLKRSFYKRRSSARLTLRQTVNITPISDTTETNADIIATFEDLTDALDEETSIDAPTDQPTRLSEMQDSTSLPNDIITVERVVSDRKSTETIINSISTQAREVFGAKHSTNSTARSTANTVTRRWNVDAETVRVTTPMVMITIVFLLSFVPYISLCLWRLVEARHERLFLSDASLVFFNIGLRSHLLNSSLNPVIYGIFNSNFRKFYFKFCCRKYK